MIKDTVIETIKQHPTLSKKLIAKILLSEHPELFNDVEAARNHVRSALGASGERQRCNEINQRLLLPPEQSKDYTPYTIPTVSNNILVLSDIHIPFHDNASIHLAVQYGVDHDCNTVLMNGDIFDFYSGSRFLKDPRLMDMKSEIQYGREFLAWLREQFPTAQIIMKIGNHEERVETYMMQNAPIIMQTDLFHVEDLLGLPDMGITCVSDKRIIKAGKLSVLHGHELRSKTGGVNPARTAYLYTHKSTLISHFHRTSMHTEPDLDKKVITCWSIGCLCNLFADYDLYNKWNQGFAVIHTDGEAFEVENMRIINRKVIN